MQGCGSQMFALVSEANWVHELPDRYCLASLEGLYTGILPLFGAFGSTLDILRSSSLLLAFDSLV